MRHLFSMIVLGLALQIAAAGAVPEPTVTASQPPAAYTLHEGDALELSVMNHDELKSSVTILPDGTVTVPVLGRVKAAGLTVDQLTSKIQEGLSVTYNQPQVSVVVQTTYGLKVNVVGAVKTPGIYDYKTGWRVLDLLAVCGGPAQDSSLTQATLWTDGGRTSKQIDVVRLMSNADPEENVSVAPGDCLIVNALNPDQGQVQVTGDVDHPGFFAAAPGGSSVMSLITLAGGGTDKAALTRVQLMHNGQMQIVNVRGMMVSIAEMKEGPLAMPGDTINVPDNTDRIAVLGEVHTPGAYDIPDGQTMTVTQAITAAGGLTPDSDAKSVEIIRQVTAPALRTASQDTAGAASGARDGSGSTVGRTDKVDLTNYLTGQAKTSSPLLQPGDMVYVPTRKHGKSGIDILQALAPIGVLSALLR